MAHMLIVDDEVKLCDCLRAYFTLKGLTVSVVYEGAKAIDRLERESPDIILLDVRLPDISGLEVLKRAKELCPKAKVIMVTALDQPETREEAAMYGAVGYITKPFDLNDPTWSLVFG
jgi:DNA-binding response OmpR family regulator